MEKNPLNLKTAHFDQHAIILKYPAVTTGRKLLLLHGAGIAGELTWTYVANYLEQWSEILVPDFAGMGRSHFLNDAQAERPSIADYSRQILELLNALDWKNIDIAGYSFGGSVTEHLLSGALADHGVNCELAYLLEPAFLSASDTSTLERKAKAYLNVSATLEQAMANDEDDMPALIGFLDQVSPRRKKNPMTDQVAVKRLRGNKKGLCQALRAVSQHLLDNRERFPEWVCPLPGMSFVGGNSNPAMQERQSRLEVDSDDWFAQVIAGADHSLVFTHPKQVARLMNERVQPLGND